MLGKKVRELLKRPQEYRDGYVDGWVDMENEYRVQQATIERLERLRSAWKEETDRLNTDNQRLHAIGKEQEQVIKGLRTQNLHLSCQLAEAQTLNQELTAGCERLTQFKEQHLLCLDTIEQLETKLKALAGAEQHLERVPGHIRQNEDDGWCWKDERLARELAEAVEYATRLFKTVAPQCEPLPNISGLLTQLDNYIAGAKNA
jgi:DNA repair exonuclease SbcCD ATPase subunit